METKEEKQQRIQKATDKINQILKEEYCFMEPVICLVGKQIISEVKVYAKALPQKVTPAETPKVEEKPEGGIKP